MFYRKLNYNRCCLNLWLDWNNFFIFKVAICCIVVDNILNCCWCNFARCYYFSFSLPRQTRRGRNCARRRRKVRCFQETKLTKDDRQGVLTSDLKTEAKNSPQLVPRAGLFLGVWRLVSLSLPLLRSFGMICSPKWYWTKKRTNCMSSFPAELSRRRSCIRARWHSAGISAAGGALKALLRLYQLPCKSQEGAVEWAGGRQRGSLVTWCWEVMCCRAELWGGRRSGQGSPGSERSGETEGFRMGLILAKLWSLFGNEGKPWFQQEFTSDLNLSLSLSEHKICLVGLDNAGKTTILYQFLMNEVVHTSPTIGSNVEEVRVAKTLRSRLFNVHLFTQQVVWNNIHFVMWDLGGQESLRTAWNTYYSNTEFIILVGIYTFWWHLISNATTSFHRW